MGGKSLKAITKSKQLTAIQESLKNASIENSKNELQQFYSKSLIPLYENIDDTNKTEIPPTYFILWSGFQMPALPDTPFLKKSIFSEHGVLWKNSNEPNEMIYFKDKVYPNNGTTTETNELIWKLDDTITVNNYTTCKIIYDNSGGLRTLKFYNSANSEPVKTLYYNIQVSNYLTKFIGNHPKNTLAIKLDKKLKDIKARLDQPTGNTSTWASAAPTTSAFVTGNNSAALSALAGIAVVGAVGAV